MKGSSKATAAGALTVLVVTTIAVAAAEEHEAEIRAIHFVSDAPVDEGDLLQLLPFQVGSTLRANDLAEARRLLELKGIFAKVEPAVLPVPEGVEIIFNLERKPIIHAVRAHGFRRLGGREAYRTLRLEAGEMYDEESVYAAVRRVEKRYRNLGYENVSVAVMPTRRLGEIDLDFYVDEGQPLVVADVVVSGNTGLPRGRLERELRRFVGEHHTPGLPREVKRILLRLLRRERYYDAEASVSWQPAEEHRGVLWADVEAGPQYTVDVSGNKHKSTAKLLRLMNLEDRLVVTAGTWRELARRMERSYHEAGYAKARVAVKIVSDPVPRVRFRVREGARYRVRRVMFQGNARFGSRRLRGQVLTRRSRFFLWNWLPGLRTGALLPDVLEEDVARIAHFYRRYGFESARVYDVVQWFDEEKHEISIVFFIEEGPQTLVASVACEGLEALGGALPRLETATAGPLDEETVARDRTRLRRALQRLGYSDAEVEASIERRQVDDQRTDAQVTFAARTGLRREVGAVVVQGNIDTRDRVILRELPFRAGDPLSTEALLEGQTNVNRLRLFRSVAVQALGPEENIRRDVGVRVTERAPGRVGWGAGYNTRDGLGGFVELTHDNLSGLARQASIRGQIAFERTDWVPNQYLGVLGFREPWLLGSRWALKTNLIGERTTRKVDQFNVEHVTLTTAVDRPLLPRLRGGLELEADRGTVFDVASDAVLTPEDEGTAYTVALSPLLAYEGRDDPFAPRRGIFDSIRLRFALPQISTVSFAKLSFHHSQYIPVSDDVIAVYALRGGWAVPLDGGDTVPIRERFFLGGRNTVRGFSENSIGPQGEKGSPLGGDLTLNANVELRFPLLFRFAGAVFVDGGGVYLQERTVTLEDFRRAAGVGLRYITPLGPLNLDYGAKLDRRRGEDFGSIHFSIGTQF